MRAPARGRKIKSCDEGEGRREGKKSKSKMGERVPTYLEEEELLLQ